MSFGYPTQYANGLNSNSQLRRSTDMIYQRGGEYEVILTGSTYNTSLELQVQLFSDDKQVGAMSIVPYNVGQSGNTYTYKFHIRPYDYLSNYVKSEHYQYYFRNDWYQTWEHINLNNPYPNKIKANIKYRYAYLSGITFTGETSYNDFNHYTQIPICATNTGFTASGFTNTGNYFDLLGGSFQMGTDKYLLPNFDQELGTALSGNTILTLDSYRTLSPMSQYYIDYPNTPQMSDSSRFLTDAPRIQYIQSNENYVLYYLNGLTGDRQYMEADWANFRFYNENNELITQFEQQLNWSGTTYATPTTGYTDTLKMFALPCGPVDIQNIFSSLNTGNGDVAYYTVQLCYGEPTFADDFTRITAGGIGPSSELFYFYITDNCKPEDTRLAFLNQRGGYDYFTFTSYRQDTKKISRQTFDNRYYSTSQQSPDRNVGRTVKTFDTNVDREFVLESDWLNVSYGNWLEQLFMSPQVYEMKDDFTSPLDRQDKIYKDLRPIQVLSTEVQTITKKHQKLNKYRITCKYADGYFVSKGF
jgi:hypothetical protein